ncbi:hypothetical protein [Psychrobacter immobilis]|uniref:hypothetical protein n=1 Tax=Psychrobacter immobilis TaxID=498 RepID=UPI00191ABB4F|nr:hypothetical protein [Psychrobacter immobilis]
MVNLSTFQQYLNTDSPTLQALTKSLNLTQSMNSDEQHLRKWALLLPMQTEAQQIEQLEQVLTELRVANIDDRQRLTLLSIVIDAANQLIATLRQHYIYETAAFNDYQLGYVAQVKSLYYLIIMVYDGVIQRENAFLADKQQQPSSNLWQRYFTDERSSTITLAVASYQTLLIYQKLLFEDALCYQKPAAYLWSNINQLYYMACQQHTVNIDLNPYIITHCADNIHRLYSQLCLHSLLNVRAMRRPTVLMVQRLLLEWSEHLVTSIEPQTETKVFVNLHSDNPPTYLTAHSAINPYDAHHDCVFIELAPLIAYLKSRSLNLIEEAREGVECYLLNTIAMTLSYCYIQPPLTLPIKQSDRQAVQLITGFNNIHYRLSNGQSLSMLICAKNLPDQQQPRYDTLPKNKSVHKPLMVETFDSKNDLSHFCTLRLLSKLAEPTVIKKVNIYNGTAAPTENIKIENVLKGQYSAKKVRNVAGIAENDVLVSVEPPPLRIMSLFLLCRSEKLESNDWSMGLVRWLDMDSEKPELDWQVVGHQLIACGIRLQDRDSRSRHFVPAFVIGDDEQLQTGCSLIVPTSYFQEGDKVMMRINTKQKTLRLGRRLLTTDEFSQYEVVQI